MCTHVFRGAYCDGTYFGSGDVQKGVVGRKPDRILSERDNGFCVIADAEWDLPPGEYVYRSKAYPPGYDSRTRLIVDEHGIRKEPFPDE